MYDNLNYVFHKGYFDVFYDDQYNLDKPCEKAILERECFKRNNQKLINFEFCGENLMQNALFSDHKNYKELNFEILYPGLIMGIGNAHEAKVNVNDKMLSKKEKDAAEKAANEAQAELIKLGFSFDYVSGLPYLPGSSVKGILRSAFKGEKYEAVLYILKNLESSILSTDGEIDKQAEENLVAQEKKKPPTEGRAKWLEDERIRLQKEELKLIEQAIFGESVKDNVHVAHEDVFLDAIIESGALKERIIKGGNLLDYEYITSHLADDPKYQGLTAPNPVRLLKIRPGVKIKFRFILTDTTVKNPDTGKEITIKKDTKLQLFKEIIKLFGVGAKTNVGYGQLEEA